ncbi:MAG TPA: hypothetical protein VIH53_01625 [Gemmatimonadaceae bacterium]
MTGRPDKKEGSRTSGKKRAAPDPVGKAHINLAKALTKVFSAGVYNKEELQNAVCTFVSVLKANGETGDGVVRAAHGLGKEIAGRFRPSARTEALLAEMVTWCLAEYYRESA